MAYLEYRYGDMSAWGTPASLKERSRVEESGQTLFVHPHELGKKVSEVGSAIKDIGKEIERLRIAPSHECVDYAALKDLLDKDKPPEGVKERRKFIKNVKKIVRSHPAHQEG